MSSKRSAAILKKRRSVPASSPKSPATAVPASSGLCQKVLGGWANICYEYHEALRSNCLNWGIVPLPSTKQSPSTTPTEIGSISPAFAQRF